MKSEALRENWRRERKKERERDKREEREREKEREREGEREKERERERKGEREREKERYLSHHSALSRLLRKMYTNPKSNREIITPVQSPSQILL